MHRDRRGLTLVEITVAFSLLMVGLLGTLSVMASGLGLAEDSLMRSRAERAVRTRVAELRAAPWDFLLADFDGQITSFGSGGTVIVEITDEATAAAMLGAPCDLDLDGSVDEAEPAHNAMQTFCVRVRAAWAASAGPQQVEQVLLLNERR